MKRIFVTGIAGFIGFHLALALKKRGDAVYGCDNFNTYYDPELKKERARRLELCGIPVIDCDIVDRKPLENALEKNEITHLVHLAAQAGVRYSLHHPESYVHSNLNGFVHILELLRLFPSIKLTYASSSSVYGLNAKTPFSETDPVDRPASFYGATKRSNELIAHSYHHLHGLSCTALRFFTVYGPWGRPDMAYYAFTKAILREEPIAVFGEGKLLRDFTYIDDIVQGTLAAIDLRSCKRNFQPRQQPSHKRLGADLHFRNITREESPPRVQAHPSWRCASYVCRHHQKQKGPWVCTHHLFERRAKAIYRLVSNTGLTAYFLIK